jgi:hypothetical protein
MGENVMYLVPICGIVGVFTFLTVKVWLGGQRKEREAFYKAETLRRITETSGEGAKAAIDLLKEDERLKRIKSREGNKIGGLVCVAVGVGSVIFMWNMSKTDPGVPYLVGLVPGLVGVAMLVYVYFLAAPVE